MPTETGPLTYQAGPELCVHHRWAFSGSREPWWPFFRLAAKHQLCELEEPCLACPRSWARGSAGSALEECPEEP